jgi:hypothetical protein
MNSEFPGLITAGCNHTPVTVAAYRDGFAAKSAIPQIFNMHIKCIQIKVSNGPVVS